jgi:KUP system potassium uptake protein
MPATIAILATLFAVQGFGTHRVSSVFGPITSSWFAMLGVTGVMHIADDPSVLAAFNPVHAVAFMAAEPGIALVVLGAAFLVVTGAEALYADLGHFGRKPIWLAWFGVAFPCLTLNYFGQGAYILARGTAVKQPFFEMMPANLLVPAIILTTLATIIASQAVITGAFSLARQATRLGILPRFEVVHTSETQYGQIYVPRINTLLFIAVLLLVIVFESSGALASAYGLAVSGNMVVTSFLLIVVMRRLWRWPVVAVAASMLPLITLDLSFLGANALKFFDGGWATVAISAAMFVIMWTWMRGSRILFEKTRRNEIPLADLADNLSRKPPHLVKGTAVFLTGDPQLAPTALLHSLKHYGVLHESNVILNVSTAMSPRVPDNERVRIEPLNSLFKRVILRFGYMETPDLPKALAIARRNGWKSDIMSTTFFLSRRTLKVSPNSGMPAWQDRLFIALARQAADATAYFRIPTNRAVELGTQVTV